MDDFFKELFEGAGEKLRTPQVLGIIAIILLIFRVTFSEDFINLMTVFVNGLGKFGFFVNVIHLMTVMLLISSVIVFIVVIFFTITYCGMLIITEKKKNLPEWLIEWINTLQRFFIGSKTATMNVCMWLLVALCYLFMFDEVTFYRYKSIILNFIIQANILIQGLSVLYSIVLFISFLRLIEGIFYKFLYFKLDKETEKLLYDVRNK